MPITDNLREKAQALIDAVQQDTPGLYSRLAAILAQENVARQNAGLTPLSPKAWILESLIRGAISVELQAKMEEINEAAEADKRQKLQQADEEIRGLM